MNEIASETQIGMVALKVSDLQRSLLFYEEILGFQVHSRENGSVILGAGDLDILYLQETSGGRAGGRTTGLYHFAILLPARRDLARLLKHFQTNEVRLQGFSDHLVSEAIYLADPDGNGIEVYRDRPRSEWPFRDGQLGMATEPLDLASLLGELQGHGESWSELPEGSKMGHIHLHVADLQKAERFYNEVIGFQLMTRYGPSASFLSAGGYHHHVGINVWAGVGAPPPPADAVGLDWFSIDLPSDLALQSVLTRVEEARVSTETRPEGILLRDPSHNAIILRTS